MQAPEIELGSAMAGSSNTQAPNTRLEPRLDDPSFAPSVEAPIIAPSLETPFAERPTQGQEPVNRQTTPAYESLGSSSSSATPKNYDTLVSLIPVRLRKPLDKALGAALCAFSLMGAIALATWTISDPSLTFAHGGTVENWMGFAGASFADFTMQFLGFATIALLLAPLSWGLLKLSNRQLPAMSRRAGSGLLALVAGSAALGCIAIPEGWPLEVGLGGVVGDAILSIPRAFTGAYPGGLFATFLFVLFIIPALYALLHTCGLRHGLPAHAAQATQNGSALEHSQQAHFTSESPQSQALDDDYETGARDWGSLFAAPLGLMFHMGYSAQTLWRNWRGKNIERQPAQFTGSLKIPHPTANAETEPENGLAAALARAESHEPNLNAMEQPHQQQADWEVVPPWENETPYIAGEDTHFALDHNQNPFQPTYEAEQPVSAWDEMNPVDVPDRPVQSPTNEHAENQASLVEQRVHASAQTHPSQAPRVIERDVSDIPSPSDSPAMSAPRKPAVVKRPANSPISGTFELPSLELLAEQKAIVQDATLSNEALQENARILEGVLEDFGVKGQIIKVRPGPVVTLYELEPAPGVKSSRVIGLAEDIARSMSAIAARVAVVPGRNAIGIELPNKKRETVYLREQLSSPEFSKSKAKLAMCLGKTIGGEPVIADLAGMPHLLMAGTTGSGKSVGINTMILSLLYRLRPDQCKMIMIDPKMLELSIYDGIPHLLTPVVVDPKKAVVALKWAVREMEDRYKKMSKMGVRNIDGFNTRLTEAKAKGEVITRTVQTGFDQHTGEAIYEHEELDLEPMPFIVVIIDEMADLMMVAGKDIEGTVQRLAQMARAAGIHVIMATQRPSVDVITGTIKANFPTRISFQVTSKIDSRTILGEMGAEQLLGMGDMLFMGKGGRTTRVHGPFVDDQEVEDVVNHLKTQGVPQYLEAVTEEDEEDADAESSSSAGGGSKYDGEGDPYDRAVNIVLRDRKVSTSYIQRRLSIGYNRAASLIEKMEQEGVISAANHAGKREILIPAEDETI